MKKICRRCGVEKPLEEFHKHPETKDGKRSICKSCTNESTHRYWLKHRSDYNKWHREWRARNRDKAREQSRDGQRRRNEKFPWETHYYSAKARCSAVGNHYYKRGIKCLLFMDNVKEAWFRDKLDRIIRDNCERRKRPL